MIKNFLYSLFLHFLLILAIYASFNVNKLDQTKTSEISVSLAALDGSEDSRNFKPAAAAGEEKKVEKKKPQKTEKKPAKSEIKSLKEKVKEEPKKLAKAKPVEAIKKAVVAEKIKEFKEPEKPAEKQEEAPKIKEDKVVNENQDDKQNDSAQKEKDLGVKKESDKEQESSNDKNTTKNNAADMANNIENMNLSAREKFNIQSQLKRCYRRSIEETKMKSKEKIMIRVQLSKDGDIDSDLEAILDLKRYNDPQEIDYKIIIDNVRRAIDLCSPLRNLPLDKYDVWKEAVLEFDENDQVKQ